MTVDLAAVDAANTALQADPKAAKTTKAYASATTKAIHSLTAPTPAAPNGSPTGRWFRGDSYLNVRTPANPAIDPNSDRMIAELVARCTSGFYTNGQAAGGSWSVPVYYADASTPLRPILETRSGKTWSLPYVPAWLPPPDGGDSHMLVVRTDTGDYWEAQAFNSAALTAQGITAGNVITGDGASGASWVSVCPLPAGLILAREVAAGVIPHGVRAAIPCASSGFRLPATHSDGNDPAGPPSGARVWLPAVPAGLSAWGRMVAQAMHDYHWFVADSTGSSDTHVVLSAEAVVDGCSYPFTLDGLPASLLASMRVLA